MSSSCRDDQVRQERSVRTSQTVTNSVMRSKEPVPDRNYGGDHPEQELPGQHPDPKQDLGSGPSLTIAEAARLCGVSASTIRRHLAAGRFPTAHQ